MYKLNGLYVNRPTTLSCLPYFDLKHYVTSVLNCIVSDLLLFRIFRLQHSLGKKLVQMKLASRMKTMIDYINTICYHSFSKAACYNANDIIHWLL